MLACLEGFCACMLGRVYACMLGGFMLVCKGDYVCMLGGVYACMHGGLCLGGGFMLGCLEG